MIVQAYVALGVFVVPLVYVLFMSFKTGKYLEALDAWKEKEERRDKVMDLFVNNHVG